MNAPPARAAATTSGCFAKGKSNLGEPFERHKRGSFQLYEFDPKQREP